MRFDVLTLFPEMFELFKNTSIIGNAIEKSLLKVNCINIRDYSKNKHKKVDDYPYGGGTGMVMTAQPIFDAYNDVLSKGVLIDNIKPHCIYLSPQGKPLNQKTADRLKKLDNIILLCGHYEGIDERIIEDIVDEEISIGDYVLTGGELPAMVLMDCVARLLPGVLGANEGFVEESLYNGLLEYPQYSRPFEFNDKKVPEVLMTGHHENITNWRKLESILRTYKKRKELINEYKFSDNELELLIKNQKNIPEINELIETLKLNEEYKNIIDGIIENLIKKQKRKQRKINNSN